MLKSSIFGWYNYSTTDCHSIQRWTIYSNISINFSHVTGAPFPISQCWNMDWQHDTAPSLPLSASIRFSWLPLGSKSSKTPTSFHLGATVLIISTFCPFCVRIIFNWANQGMVELVCCAVSRIFSGVSCLCIFRAVVWDWLVSWTLKWLEEFGGWEAQPGMSCSFVTNSAVRGRSAGSLWRHCLISRISGCFPPNSCSALSRYSFRLLTSTQTWVPVASV